MREIDDGQMMWDGFSAGRMSQEPTQVGPQGERISESSSKKSAKSQTPTYAYLDVRNGANSDVSWETRSQFRGQLTTLQTFPYLSEESGYTLSQILTDAPPKYALSPRACQGILNRAEKRGKVLPEILENALRATISKSTQESQKLSTQD